VTEKLSRKIHIIRKNIDTYTHTALCSACFTASHLHSSMTRLLMTSSASN